MPAPAEAVLNARRHHIASIPDDPTRRSVHFFFSLDHATNPVLLRETGTTPTQAYLTALQRVMEGLGHRILRRASTLVGEEPDLPRLDIDSLQLLSAIQRPIYEEHFPPDGGDEDLRTAFEGFASGRFYTPSLGEWDAAPRSAMILAFAEFSIACIEALDPTAPATTAGVDGTFWAGRLPAHLTAGLVYERATGNASGPRNLHDFVEPRPDRVDSSFLMGVQSELADLESVDRLVRRHTALCQAMLGSTFTTSTQG